jgi:hypothetical protein
MYCTHERAGLRDKLLALQMEQQTRSEREARTRVDAATREGALHVSAQSAQSRVHYVEAQARR